MTVRQKFAILAVVVPLALLGLAQLWSPILWAFVAVVPIIAVGLIDMFQTKHTIKRLYPVIGNFRYLFESVRPEIQQYFVESETLSLIHI